MFDKASCLPVLHYAVLYDFRYIKERPITRMNGKKQKISELGIFGGRPAFPEKIHVGRPNIVNRKGFLDRVNTILDNQWLTNNGPFLQEFEKRISVLIVESERYLSHLFCCNYLISLTSLCQNL